MSLTTIGTTVDEVLALVDELDEVSHADLDLRTLALRCGALAAEEGADGVLVSAALLHDVGRARYLVRGAPGVPHEEVGRRFVEPRFGDRAAWLVAQHVVAQRYLATVDDGYVAGLPTDARRSLRRHGGTLTARAVRAFESHPCAADAIRVRRWSDAVVGGAEPTVDRAVLAAHLRGAWAG